MAKRLVLGTGCGRCGTASLAHLLDAQPGCLASHSCAWRPDPTAARAARLPLPADALCAWDPTAMLAQLKARSVPVAADCAAAWLGAAEAVFEQEPATRLLVLQRERQATVDSLLAVLAPEGAGPRHRALLEVYYDRFYARAQELAERYPCQVLLAPVRWLNMPRDQMRLLTFAGFPLNGDPAVTFHALRRNARAEAACPTG